MSEALLSTVSSRFKTVGLLAGDSVDFENGYIHYTVFGQLVNLTIHTGKLIRLEAFGVAADLYFEIGDVEFLCETSYLGEDGYNHNETRIISTTRW